MSNVKDILFKLADLSRKDSGINNAVESLEQLSLLIMLKYYFDCSEIDIFNAGNELRFDEFFFTESQFGESKSRPGFMLLNDSVEDMFFYAARRLTEKNNDSEVADRLKAMQPSIEVLLREIPFKFKSEKVFAFIIHELSNLSLDDGFSLAYKELIYKTESESGSFGVYVTPSALVDAIIEVIGPSKNQSIYDPAMGVGNFLFASYNRKNGKGRKVDDLIVGRDISAFACLVGSLNLLLSGSDIQGVKLGDSLLDETESTYDIILSHPPFGRSYSHEAYQSDEKVSLELAFLKHVMGKLNMNGRCALVMPQSFLFNATSPYVKIRRELLKEYNLHTVLILPPGAFFPYTNARFCVLFFDRKLMSQDVWFYNLNISPDNGYRLSEDSYSDFISQYLMRYDSENSYSISKGEILERELADLSSPPRVKRKFPEESILDRLKPIRESQDLVNTLFSDLLQLLDQLDGLKVDIEGKATLGEIFTVKSGTPLKKSEFDDEGKYPVYGANGAVGYYENFNVETDKILIGRVGAHCGNVHYVKGPFWYTGNAFGVEALDEDRVYLPYLAHVLRSLNLNSKARGTAQPSISFANIKNIEIALPSYEKQREMSDVFDRIESKNSKLGEIMTSQKTIVDGVVSDSIGMNTLLD